MTNAPYVAPRARWGARIGDTKLIDSLQHDGLWCAFDQCTMGEASDGKNAALGIDRSSQDAWSVESHRRAAAATESGHFAREIVPVAVPQRGGAGFEVAADEGIRPGLTAESLGELRAAFTGDGTITAGNASQISDGTTAVVVASRSAAEAVGAPIAAEILSYGQIGGVDPTLHERPAAAIKVALKKAELTLDDLDVIEINEGFCLCGNVVGQDAGPRPRRRESEWGSSDPRPPDRVPREHGSSSASSTNCNAAEAASGQRLCAAEAARATQ